MPNTRIGTQIILDGSVNRDDINTTTSGKAVVTKSLNGSGLSISSTGTDSGTGDVTLSLNLGNANTWTAKQTIQLTTAQLRLGYDSSNYADFTVGSAGVLTIAPSGSGIILPDFTNLTFGTTNGTKIGTATSQKLSFYNSTPIVQPSGNVSTALSNLGLIASPTTPIIIGAEVNNSNPTNNTSLRWGGFYGNSLNASAGRNYIDMPIAGTITKCYIRFFNNGTLGTAETSSMYITLNNTTDYLISSAVQNNALVTNYSNTSMSVPIAAGDVIEFKWVTPVWSTAPTTIKIAAKILLTA